MSNAWDDMRKAKEAAYFASKEQEALERLAAKSQRMSPITGEPMEIVTLNGVHIDRCPTSGGIWLDAGELERLMQIAHDQGVHDATQEGQVQNWLLGFFRNLSKPAGENK